MAYREVTMIEIKEVLRLRCLGVAKKQIAAHDARELGLGLEARRPPEARI